MTRRGVLKPRRDRVQAQYRRSGVLAGVVQGLKHNVAAIRRNSLLSPSTLQPSSAPAPAAAGNNAGGRASYVQDAAELSLRLRILQRAVFHNEANQSFVCTIADSVILDQLAKWAIHVCVCVCVCACVCVC